MSLSPLWISLATATAATALTFVLGLAAAYAMHRWRGPGRGLIDGVLTLPLVLPPTVVGFFLLLIFGRNTAVGHALEQLGIAVAFSWPGIVIAATAVAFPLMYRTALGAFEQVNPNLLGAARTLGANEWRTFRQVLLPLAGPGVIAGTVLAFARALGEFGATLMLAGNIPGRTQTMPIAIFFFAEGGDLGPAMAWVGVMAAMSLGAVAALDWVGRPRKAIEQPVEETASVAPPLLLPAATKRPAQLNVEVRKRHPGFELSVKFEAGASTLGLLGASGAGKSMLLRAIAGLEKPDSGSIALNGRILFDAQQGIDLAPAARRVGMVFQDYALFPHLTVRQNIAFGAPADKAAEWARRLQLEGLLDRLPGQLSGGQKQRVALARALAMEPEALLLDEPFAALDPHLRRQVEEQLRAVLQGFAGATILVTHDRNEAFRLAEELVVLSHGHLEAAGTRHELFANPGTLAAARVSGCKNIAAFEVEAANRIRVPAWGCSLQVAGAIPEGASFVGIRAHHLDFDSEGENAFECRVEGTVESPFEITVYLSLGGAPVEAEMPLDSWVRLQEIPQPWRVRLPAHRLLLLRAGRA